MQESGIFKTAVKLPAAERAAYLDKSCGNNAALRLEVEGLLRAHDSPGEFMQRPPIADMTTDYRPGPERPGMRVGPYKLLQLLGEGGMGTVFVAEQTEPVRRMVALKIIKPGMDSSQILARFEAERQALALMDHPNIARVLDAGQVPEPSAQTNANGDTLGRAAGSGRPYFAMELVKGVPITEFCDQNKLSTRQRLELFIPVCNAIQHAHMKGIIHRDIKPSNVLIALYDGKPVPKVIDFGVAKAMAEPLTQRTLFTQIGQVVGTFEYMSPEQATLNQLDIDTRSDIYSLGVLLYELLTGMTPFDKNRLRTLALDQLLRTIREEEPMRPSVRLSSEAGASAMAAAYRGVESSKLAGLIRGDLDWIVMKCLEKERNRRFITAGSLAQDIERYLHDEPVTACPPSLTYRARKAYRKNKAAITVVATIFALLLVGVIASSWQAFRATKAERVSAHDRDVALAAEKTANEKTAETTAALGKLNIAQDEQKKVQYAWDMQIMQTAFDSNKIAKVQEMLDRHSPDLRDFEWNYWNRQLHSALHCIKLGGESDGEHPLQRSWRLSDDGQRAFAFTTVVSAENEDHSSFTRMFLDVYNTTDGKHVCRHPLNDKDVAPGVFPSATVMSYGDLVAANWSTMFRTSPGQTSFAPASRAREYRLIDVVANRTVETLTSPFGAASGDKFARSVGGIRFIRFTQPEKDGVGRVMSVCELESGALKELWHASVSAKTTWIEVVDPIALPGALGSLKSETGRIAALKVDPIDETKTMLAVWDIATGKEVMSVPNALPSIVEMAFSHDGKHLALFSGQRTLAALRDDPKPTESTLMVVDVDSGRERLVRKLTTDTGITPGGRHLYFNPDSSKLYLVQQPLRDSARRVAKLSAWDLETGNELSGLDCELSPGETPVFSPDGTRLVTRSSNVLEIRNAITGRMLHTLRGHVQTITQVVQSSDGRRLYSIDAGGEFKEWDARPPEPLIFADTTYSAMSPDGRYLASIGQILRGNTTPPDAKPETVPIVLWDRTDGSTHNLILAPLPVEINRGPVRIIRFCPNGALVSILRSTSIRFSRQTFDSPQLPGRNEPDNETEFADLTVFDVATQKQLAHLNLPFTCLKAQVSSDGRFAVVATPKQVIKCFDLSSGQEIWTRASKYAISDRSFFAAGSLFLSPDGRLAAYTDISPTGRNGPATRVRTATTLLDMATGREVRSFPDIFPTGSDSCFAWSSDSSRIAMSSNVGTSSSSAPIFYLAKVFDVTTGKMLMKVERSPGGAATRSALAFSPDGRRLAGYTCSLPGPSSEVDAVRIWDVETGTELLNLPLANPSDGRVGTGPGFGGVGHIAFSPDGYRLICAQASARSRQLPTHTTLRVIDATPVPPTSEK